MFIEFSQFLKLENQLTSNKIQNQVNSVVTVQATNQQQAYKMLRYKMVYKLMKR
jgi:hypothetical protein